MGGSTLAQAPSLRSSPDLLRSLGRQSLLHLPLPSKVLWGPFKGWGLSRLHPSIRAPPTNPWGHLRGGDYTNGPLTRGPPNPESTSGDRSAPNSRDTGNTLETPGGWVDLPQDAALTQGPPAPPGYPSENTTHPSLHPCLRRSPDKQGSVGGGASASLHLSHGVGAAETLGDPS